MGMILTNDITHDTGRLFVWFIIVVLELPHGKENPAVNGFQAITYIRKRPSNDDAHGILKV